MNKTIDILRDLIAFNTVSRDPNRDLIDYVVRRLEHIGVDATLIPNDDGPKANLFASIGPRVNGGVMLSGHTDVVPIDGQNWTRPAFECTQEDNRLYGRGTADMKGFVAAALASFEAAKKLPLKTPLHIALSYDEEIGCIGVRSMLEMMKTAPFTPDMCIVGEPTEMGLATGHKGKTAIQAACHGRAGHSALAPMAVNALHLACDLTSEIRATQANIEANGTKDPAYNVPYTTLHVGKLHGGIQVNIVPHEAIVDFEIRNLAQDDPATILQQIKDRIAPIIAAAQTRAAEADITFTITNSYPGLETPVEAGIVTMMKSLTGINTTIKVAFGTEGGLFSRDLGIPTVVCGPGSMEQGHKPDEFVTTDQLALCDDMLGKLNERLVAGL